MILTRGRGPTYLEKTRLRRWEGSILVKVRIDEQGIPTYPRIVWSSHEVGIVLASCEFTRELVYTPATKDGKPIAVLSEQKTSYRQD